MQVSRVFRALYRRLRFAGLAALAPHRLFIYDRPASDHHQLSFSQEGEDLILARMFEGSPPGTFVDVGAHHPQRFSNTYRMHLDGWRGVNIDATPGSMAPFRALRPDDVNLEVAISEHSAQLIFHRFNEPALNTFSADLALSRDGRDGYLITERREIRTRRLDEVLAQHLPEGRSVAFLNIDVEGLEMEVLRSNDWSRVRPAVVAVEIYGSPDMRAALESPAGQELSAQGYELVAKTANTSIFLRPGALPVR